LTFYTKYVIFFVINAKKGSFPQENRFRECPVGVRVYGVADLSPQSRFPEILVGKYG